MENNSLVFLLNKHLISSKCRDTWFSRGGQDFSNESVQGGEYAEADINYCFSHSCTIWEYLELSSAIPSNSASCPCLYESTDDGSTGCHPPWKNVDECPGSWLQSGPPPAVLGICKLNQRMEDFPFPFYHYAFK